MTIFWYPSNNIVCNMHNLFHGIAVIKHSTRWIVYTRNLMTTSESLHGFIVSFSVISGFWHVVRIFYSNLKIIKKIWVRLFDFTIHLLSLIENVPYVHPLSSYLQDCLTILLSNTPCQLQPEGRGIVRIVNCSMIEFRGISICFTTVTIIKEALVWNCRHGIYFDLQLCYIRI